LLLVLLVVLAAGLAFALTGSILPAAAILAVSAAGAAWQLSTRTSVGIFLMLMPLQWLVIAVLQFAGVAQYQAISGMKEVILVAATLWFLSRSSRLRLTIPDAVLVSVLTLAIFEQIFHTDIKGLRDDWEWTIVYLLGRVLVLRPSTQALWAKAAVWMAAVLSLIGIWEVEYLGSAPRLLLLRTAYGDTRLPSAFTATGYSGLRAASTMASPLIFSGLCVVALVLWWIYMKNPIPAIIIGTGLTFTLTRSAFVAALVAVVVAGIRRREKIRLSALAAVVAVGLAIAIPTLDLSHFLNATLNFGADTSTLGHQTSIVHGFEVMLDHPLGIGAGTVGPRQVEKSSDALSIESSLLTIAIEYGIAGGALYAAFLIACLWSMWRLQEPVGYAGFSILLGYFLLLCVGPLHFDIPLGCWVWFAVGMAITRAAETGDIASISAA
jgi:hypothetical protein